MNQNSLSSGRIISDSSNSLEVKIFLPLKLLRIIVKLEKYVVIISPQLWYIKKLDVSLKMVGILTRKLLLSHEVEKYLWDTSRWINVIKSPQWLKTPQFFEYTLNNI